MNHEKSLTLNPYYEKESKVKAILFTRDNFDKIRKITDGRAYDLTIERTPDGACYFSLAVPGHGIQKIYENNYLLFSDTGSFIKAVSKEKFEENYISVPKDTQKICLKCNIGDILYYPDDLYHTVFMLHVNEIVISKGCKGTPIYQYNCCSYDAYGDPWDDYEFEDSDFDKIVFLDQEKAEKNLNQKIENIIKNTPVVPR